MKNFIYLNDYRLDSLGMQLFEEAGAATSDKVAQDRAFLRLEAELGKRGKVLEVDQDSVGDSDVLAQAVDYHFVKVTGKAVFIDAQTMIANLGRFNQIGEAITFVTHYGELNRMHEEYRDLVDKVNQSSANKHMKQNKLKELEKAYQQSTDIKELVKGSHLHTDQNFMDMVSLLLDYGYQDQFEMQLKAGGAIFAGVLAPDKLREPARLVVRRYAKQSDRRFTLFGVVTQHPQAKSEPGAPSGDATSIKEAVINLALQLSNVDTQFAGKLSNEVTLDPIAVYTEL